MNDEPDYEQIQEIADALGEKGLEVLRLTSDYEPARASTIKEAVYWASRNQDIHYRWQKLEEHGLIAREEVEKSDYPIPPKEARITPLGHHVATHAETNGHQSLEERVERVEKQLGVMRRTYGEVKDRIVALEEAVEAHDDDLDEISRRVERVGEELDGAPDPGELQF